MRVRVTITVDIKDPSEWTTTFGVEGAAEIREDVKSYVGNAAQGLRVWEEVEAEVNWR
ncbi:hypothetical protein KGG77_gp18 [Streptomyces phage Omar]|uniref:Uncharacterized protein n=1 Tax=Streptomyces phage Omar TaxID=2059882 RepID=A0A2H5BLP0_9CAUD|nr:hypothetical protein KGG77_gp18 [Streptomyces phage Omar]AUG87250.1 hypothetical protein SEA_OMAR_66 [Streptomyces phage Omar]